VHLFARACSRTLQLTLRELDELAEDLRLVRIEAMSAASITVPRVRHEQLPAKRMQPMHIPPVVRPCTRLLDLALNPGVGPTLSGALCVRITVAVRSSPTIDDAHDLVMVSLFIVKLAAHLEDSLGALGPRAAVIIPRRHGVDRRPRGPRAWMTGLGRDDNRGAPLAAPATFVRTGLAYGGQRQCKESKMN
jgi:hypothetical protein